MGSRAAIRQQTPRYVMKILGISGFENSMPFKRAHWPGLDEREYRISQGHDAAAALVIGACLGRVLLRRFAGRTDPPDADERFCRAAARTLLQGLAPETE